MKGSFFWNITSYNLLKINWRVGGTCCLHLQVRRISQEIYQGEIGSKHNHFSDRHFDRLCGLVVRVPGYRSRGPGFDSRQYQNFWEAVGLERVPLRLVSTTEELLGRNSSGSGLENREYGCGDPLRWPRDILHPQMLTLTSPTSGGGSVAIVRLRTKATEFVCFLTDTVLHRLLAHPSHSTDRHCAAQTDSTSDPLYRETLCCTDC
jgi:hypothetical protein